MKATVKTYLKGQGHIEQLVDADAVSIGKTGKVTLERTPNGFKVIKNGWLWKEITYITD